MNEIASTGIMLRKLAMHCSAAVLFVSIYSGCATNSSTVIDAGQISVLSSAKTVFIDCPGSEYAVTGIEGDARRQYVASARRALLDAGLSVVDSMSHQPDPDLILRIDAKEKSTKMRFQWSSNYGGSYSKVEDVPYLFSGHVELMTATQVRILCFDFSGRGAPVSLGTAYVTPEGAKQAASDLASKLVKALAKRNSSIP